MRKIRVLVVDDSAVARRALTDILSADPEIDVVGTASNGRIALATIPQLLPDVITLDVEMPDMGGLETLAAICEKFPHSCVIMFSARTRQGAEATIEALSRGAADYVTKPDNTESAAAAAASVRDQLVPKIKLLCTADRSAATAAPSAAASRLKGNCTTPNTPLPNPPHQGKGVNATLHAEIPSVTPSPANIASLLDRSLTESRQHRVDIVAIGVSTGGPAALDLLVPAIPADFPAPILIVQHMPELFTRSLADRLSSRSKIAVREALDGEAIMPGTAFIAPGGQHMEVRLAGKSPHIHTHRSAPENSCRPSADVLFRSVAMAYDAKSMAVIMTGMGQDGTAGARQIHACGGIVLAQDEATSVVWGMPGSVVRAGIAHRVLPLRQLASEIIGRARIGRMGVTPNHAQHPGR